MNEMKGSGCKDCPVIPCETMNYRGSTCSAQRAKFGLGDPLTNADRIRAMTDEELAAWIVETTYICACCSVIEGCQDAPHVSVCKKNVAEWLQQPAKEET